MQTIQELRSGLLTGCKKVKISEQLKEFPHELFSLTESLEVLDLSNNLLSELPDDFGRFKQLKILFLSDNLFIELPSVIATCPKLEMIGFKANQIESLAENSLPSNTRWLILTDNKITSLPNSMGSLLKLQKCMLAGNHLTELPESMAACHSLELLRISANQLVSLPNWLLELPKLSWLAFSGNKFCQENKRSDLIQAELSEFELFEVLGQGASGVIYRAKWHKSSKTNARDVAVKLFKGAVTSDGYPDDELAISLMIGGHPSLPQVLAQVTSNEQKGLVMKLIPSDYRNLGLPPSLQSCTRDTFKETSAFSANTILSIGKAIADALVHLHQRGLCHGDLYAHNILVNDDGSVLLTDFGAASKMPEDKVSLLTRIEHRAFGCLLDDLLQFLPASDEHTELANLLMSVRDDCCSAPGQTFSSFEDITARLS